MQLTYRGSVNRWECDENDHLNVRFCEQKLYQTLLSGLLSNDCIGVAEVAGLPRTIRRQHIRFQAESRIAAPLGGYFSPVVSDDFQVVVELRNEATGTVACSMLCDFADDKLVSRLQGLSNPVRPDAIAHAWGRGIQQNLDLHDVSLEQATQLGFRTIGAGVIEQEECSADSLLLPYHCMGRISDSMPHLWGTIFPESHADGKVGGAVVEFRRTYGDTLFSGEPFQIKSGIVEVGPKVQSFAHLIFNGRTGQCCVNAQAVALRMDLEARKAITLDDGALAKLHAQKITLSNR